MEELLGDQSVQSPACSHDFPQRIWVLGSSCAAGKSTLAKELGQALGVRAIELDALRWGPEWSRRPAAEVRAQLVSRLEAKPCVVDGNATSVGLDLLELADLIIWLDPPLWKCLFLLVRRSYRRIATGERVCGTNRESLASLLGWNRGLLFKCIKKHRRSRRSFIPQLAPYRYVRLQSHREVRSWLSVTFPSKDA